MRGKFLIIIALVLLNNFKGSSQEINLISLDDVLQKVANNNQTNKIAQ